MLFLKESSKGSSIVDLSIRVRIYINIFFDGTTIGLFHLRLERLYPINLEKNLATLASTALIISPILWEYHRNHPGDMSLRKRAIAFLKRSAIANLKPNVKEVSSTGTHNQKVPHHRP
jgi:hypothetical protein